MTKGVFLATALAVTDVAQSRLSSLEAAVANTSLFDKRKELQARFMCQRLASSRRTYQSGHMAEGLECCCEA